MHQALYRKWRPHIFNDVYGQEHITSVLKYEIENGKLSHAYLFCGSRGVGKTTCAKILAKAVNCENPQNGEPCGKCESCLAIESGSATDVLEMDAASNNGVENIRDIRDEVVFAPSQLKYRVYIVDEVHMLSASAFNALLKTLEEPPSYVIFILATTEQHKLPATIISRCQRFEFRRISTERLMSRINLIAEQEGIAIENDAAHLIARLSQGGMRDAISLLELCAGANRTITPELVNETVGSTGRERTARVATAIAVKNYNTIFDEIAELVRSSKNISVFWQDMISFWRDMLIFKTTPDASRYLDLTDAETASLSDIAGYFTRETLLWQCRLLDDALAKIIRSSATARTTAELYLLRMCDERLDSRSDSLLSRIAKLEERISSGSFSVPLTASDTPIPEKKPANEGKKATVPKKKEAPAPKADNSTPTADVPQITVEEKTPAAVEEIAPVKKTDKAVSRPKSTRALRPLRAWSDVLDELSVTDIFVWINISTSKAFYDEEENIVVVFDSEFALQRADNDETRAKVAEAVASQLGKRNKISFEYLPEQEQKDSIIDDLLDNF